MSATAHRPGPWKVFEDSKRVVLDKPEYYLIAQTLEAHDARLIAAAPDMLAALRLVEEERGPQLDEMRNLTCGDLCDKTFEFQGCPSGKCAREIGIRKFEEVTATIRAAIAKATGAA